MYCNKCGSKNPEGSNYCFKCGSKLVVIDNPSELIANSTCPKCGANMVYDSDNDIMFCEYCDTKQAFRDEKSLEFKKMSLDNEKDKRYHERYLTEKSQEFKLKIKKENSELLNYVIVLVWVLGTLLLLFFGFN